MRLYLLVAWLAVTALALSTPPFQVPDEQQHFFRAYEISEGQVFSVTEAGAAGAVLPSSLIELSAAYLGSRALHADRRVGRPPMAGAWARPLEPARREFIDFTGAAAYWPGAYLPQAAAIAAGRAAGLGPLALLYAARLLNAWVAVALTGLALAALPAGRRAVFVVGLLPMTLYEMASCSADAATIGTALAFTGLAAGALARGGWSWRRIAATAAAALVFCPLKPVYAPLLLLALPFGRGGRRGWVAQAIILAVAGVATAAWLRASPVAAAAPFPGVDPGAQLRFALAHPLHFPHAVALTTEIYGRQWAEQVAGVLGWLTVHLPWPMLAAAAAALAGCVLVPAPSWRPGWVRACWMLALAGASFALVLLALDLLWSPVGALVIEGAQGRYFIPLAGAVAVALEGAAPVLRPVLSARLGRGILALGVAEAVLTVGVVLRGFGVA